MKKSGFTLIELAIVLVVIGLVVSGAIVGISLVRSASLRGDIKVVEEINAGVQAFDLKYNCLPGDCATASSKLSGASNGDGNGNLWSGKSPSGFGNAMEYTGEIANFADHLSKSGLLGVKTAPLLKSNNGDHKYILPMPLFNTYWATSSDIIGNVYRLGVRINSNQATSWANGDGTYTDLTYTPAEIKYIDEKIDDSMPKTGIVTAPWFMMNHITQSPASTPTCSNASGYNLTITTKTCGLFIKAPW